MIKVKCPYSETELMTAMLDFPELPNEKMLEAGQIMAEQFKGLTIPSVAKRCELSTKDLVNSRNYDKIMLSETKKILTKVAREFTELLGINDQQAWLILSTLADPQKYRGDYVSGRKKKEEKPGDSTKDEDGAESKPV